jgi:hypothetical protein
MVAASSKASPHQTLLPTTPRAIGRNRPAVTDHGPKYAIVRHLLLQHSDPAEAARARAADREKDRSANDALSNDGRAEQITSSRAVPSMANGPPCGAERDQPGGLTRGSRRPAAGKTVAGIVVAEDEATVKLKTADGTVVALPAKSIEARASGPSAMPADLVAKISRRELRDLLEWLATLRK